MTNFRCFISVFLCIFFSSCLTRSAELKVKFINHSKSKYYVGELYDCDSCGIKIEIKQYCSNPNDSTYFPRVLMAGDSTVMRTKFLGTEKVFAINADSLDVHCKKGDISHVLKSAWIKVFQDINLDENNRTCRFIIN